MHLGMTGRFEIDGGRQTTRPGDFVYAPAADPKHAHVLFETEAGVRVTYFDPRRFGFMGLIPADALDAHPWFADMGPEPLGPQFTAAHLAAAFAGRKQPVKAMLLDQRVVAGLGNIYVCEALHRAGVSPERAAGKVSRPKIAALVAAVIDVLREAIDAGGSTLRDYAAADGALGYFQHSFRAYGREHEPCRRAGCSGVIRRIVQSGRSSFYCGVCQR
jgi:formamidopyrimidine-DNA glycosylase